MNTKNIFTLAFSGILILLTIYFAAADVVLPTQTWPEDTISTINLGNYFPTGYDNYGVVSQPANIAVSIDQSTHIATFSPNANFFGSRKVQFYASNASNSSDTIFSNNMTLVVTGVADAPQITSGPLTHVEPNTLYQYQVSASDADGDSLTYFLVSPPSGMTISSNGLISWVPENTGDHNIEVRVNDGSLTATQTYTLSVKYTDKLIINDIKVIVDGKSQSGLDDAERINKEAEPGSKVSVDVKVENLFTNDEDIDIEDIEITVRIDGVDDGDDLEEDGDSFDLRSDRTKTQKFSFELPILVDEGDYDIVIEAEGEDQNGRVHRDSATLTLEVQKNRHDLLIRKATLSNDKLSCQRTTSLNVEVLNIGSEDEDNVAIVVTGSTFGFTARDDEIELVEGSDEDSVFEKTYNINAATLPPGFYTLDIKTYYDGDNLEDTQTATFYVEKCGDQSTTGSQTGSQTGSGSQATGSQAGTSGTGTGIDVNYVTQPTGGVIAEPVGTGDGDVGILSSGIVGPLMLVFGIIIILLIGGWIVKMMTVRR